MNNEREARGTSVCSTVNEFPCCKDVSIQEEMKDIQEVSEFYGGYPNNLIRHQEIKNVFIFGIKLGEN